MTAGGLGHQNTRRWYSTDAEAYTALNASALILIDDRVDTGMAPIQVLGIWDGIDVDQKSWRLQMDDSSFVLDSFVIFFNAGRSQFSFNIRQAGIHTWGFRMDNTADSTRAYRDGHFVEAATEFGSYLEAGNTNAYPFLGAPPTSTGISVLTSLIWNRDIGEDLMLWATTEPYVFLRPIVRRRYFVLGGAPAFQAAWAGPRTFTVGAGRVA